MGREIKDINDLKTMILEGSSVEAVYNLNDTNRSGLLMTHIDNATDESYSVRVLKSPRIKLIREEGKTFLDITDINGNTLVDIDDRDGKTPKKIQYTNGQEVKKPYRNLTLSSPRTADIERPETPHDLGYLQIGLENNRTLAICPFKDI